MRPNEAILIVLLVVLILVVASQGQTCSGQKGSFTAAPPFLDARRQTEALRGFRDDAFRQDPPLKRGGAPPGGDHYQAWAAGPRDLEEAQRAAWFEATAEGEGASSYEGGGGAADELSRHHTPAPSINYQDTLVDLIADPRMRAQHANWHSEVAPKSQGAMRVDDLDEAAAISSYGGHGLYSFRFSAPEQRNPLFITDQDAETYAPHTTKFSFGG